MWKIEKIRMATAIVQAKNGKNRSSALTVESETKNKVDNPRIDLKNLAIYWTSGMKKKKWSTMPAIPFDALK